MTEARKSTAHGARYPKRPERTTVMSSKRKFLTHAAFQGRCAVIEATEVTDRASLYLQMSFLGGLTLEIVMVRKSSLSEELEILVRHYGLSSVLHSLADLQAAPRQSISSSWSGRRRSAGSKASAVDYVRKMTLPREKAEVMACAARRFEDKEFLPSIADIRDFCDAHGVELSKSVSRASSIPRVFTYLAKMDTARVSKVLDNGEFSGPTTLSPIADAIRNCSTRNRRAYHRANAQSTSDAAMVDGSENR